MSEQIKVKEKCGAIYFDRVLGSFHCVRPKGHDKYHATRTEPVEEAEGGMFWHSDARVHKEYV